MTLTRFPVGNVAAVRSRAVGGASPAHQELVSPSQCTDSAGNLVHTVDHRGYYATLLDEWLEVDHDPRRVVRNAGSEQQHAGCHREANRSPTRAPLAADCLTGRRRRCGTVARCDAFSSPWHSLRLRARLLQLRPHLTRTTDRAHSPARRLESSSRACSMAIRFE